VVGLLPVDNHLHKAFWSVILLIFSLLIYIFGREIFVAFALAGIILILISVIGHIYTNNRPYFKLWDKYKKN
jgi:hypothetical protein